MTKNTTRDLATPLAATPEAKSPEIFGIGKRSREKREERQIRRNVCRRGRCGGRAKGYVGFD